jgi:hypothetical protein
MELQLLLDPPSDRSSSCVVYQPTAWAIAYPYPFCRMFSASRRANIPREKRCKMTAARHPLNTLNTRLLRPTPRFPRRPLVPPSWAPPSAFSASRTQVPVGPLGVFRFSVSRTTCLAARVWFICSTCRSIEFLARCVSRGSPECKYATEVLVRGGGPALTNGRRVDDATPSCVTPVALLPDVSCVPGWVPCGSKRGVVSIPALLCLSMCLSNDRRVRAVAGRTRLPGCVT